MTTTEDVARIRCAADDYRRMCRDFAADCRRMGQWARALGRVDIAMGAAWAEAFWTAQAEAGR